MRRALFFIVAIFCSATSYASIQRVSVLDGASISRASMLDAAPPIADTLSETRIRVSDVLAPFERPVPNPLNRALHQAYAASSTTNASGLGRFLSVDPGKDWDPKQPQSWNMYAYVRNNPINATDPNGKEIRYTDAYRALVRNNPDYAQAHRAWYNSPQGRAQHRAMGFDTNTVYTIGVGKVTLSPFTNEQRAGGTWPPAGAAKTGAANKLDSPEVTVKINVEYLSEPKLQVKAAAETIFHEVTHALDVGSGAVTRDQAIRSEEKLEEQDGTPDPRLEQYRRTLDETIPPR